MSLFPFTMDSSEEIEPKVPHCPRCGAELKRMRCRIDAPELYCPLCRDTVEPPDPQKLTR